MNSASRSNPPGKDSERQPKQGAAGSGKLFDPRGVPDEGSSDERARKEPFPAPAPGIPVSKEQYDRLKEKAKSVRIPRSKHSQEDPSGTRKA